MSNIAPPQQRYWKERYAEMLEMPSEKVYGVAVENEMIVRVRQALFDALCEHLSDADGVAMQGGRFFISGADSHIDGAVLARAAIAAMREPTKHAEDTGAAMYRDCRDHDRTGQAAAWHIWTAMIDTALTQPKEG